jgi:hypothetical protein
MTLMREYGKGADAPRQTLPPPSPHDSPWGILSRGSTGMEEAQGRTVQLLHVWDVLLQDPVINRVRM